VQTDRGWVVRMSAYRKDETLVHLDSEPMTEEQARAAVEDITWDEDEARRAIDRKNGVKRWGT
jgi:hypothetical protein